MASKISIANTALSLVDLAILAGAITVAAGLALSVAVITRDFCKIRGRS